MYRQFIQFQVKPQTSIVLGRMGPRLHSQNETANMEENKRRNDVGKE